MFPWLLCGYRDETQVAQANKQEDIHGENNNSHAMFIH